MTLRIDMNDPPTQRMTLEAAKVDWWGVSPPPSDGWRVIEFAEAFCRYTKGPQAGQLIRLRVWQKEILLELFEIDPAGSRLYRRGLVGLPRKNGKACDHDTPVPTPLGMMRHGDLRVGDFVYDAKGWPRRVLALSDDFDVDHRVTFAGGESIVCHEAHEWSVYLPDSEPLHDRETGQLIEDNARARAQGQRVTVPVTQPVAGIPIELPCDPYILGLWLGDGSSWGAQLTVGAQDVAAIRSLITAAGGELRGNGGGKGVIYGLWVPGRRAVNGRRNGVVDAIKDLGLHRNKHIPELLLCASWPQRLALLQGLMDADGTCSGNGAHPSPELCTTSSMIAIQFRRLAASLGYKVRISQGLATIRGRDCGPRWTISLVGGPHVPFRLPRKVAQVRAWGKRSQRRAIVSIDKVSPRPGRCIEVEGGQYLVGVDHIPTHNSLLGAIIALYCLIADGEAGAEVYSVAGDRDQARVVFDEVMRMVRLEPQLSAMLKIRDAQATILHDASGSVYRAIASDSSTAEGLNPSCVIFDEVHVQRNRKLWTVMTSGSATRGRALVLGITTAGYDLTTVCGGLYKMGRKGGGRGFFFRWWEPAKPDCDITDEAVWHQCNPGLGDFQNIEDFRVALAEALETGAENEFRRYRLNQWTGSVESWLPFNAWSALEDRSPLDEAETCVLGFDGSYSGDSTAIVACAFQRDKPHLVPLNVWEKPEGMEGEGWRVPILEVEAAIIAACKTYDVREVACDPYRWQRSMAVLEEAGVPVVEYPTASPARMVPATTLFTDGVRDGTLTHDGNADLARHIANAKIKRDSRGPRIVKEHANSAKKIDLAVAAVIALDRGLNQPAEKPPSRGPQLW